METRKRSMKNGTDFLHCLIRCLLHLAASSSPLIWELLAFFSQGLLLLFISSTTCKQYIIAHLSQGLLLSAAFSLSSEFPRLRYRLPRVIDVSCFQQAFLLAKH